MNEDVKIVSEREVKDIQIKGATPIKETERKDVEIVGGSSAGMTGPVRTLDRNSPVEPTLTHEVIHADRKSFKDAVENDQ